MPIYHVDKLDGNVYDQNHHLADPVKMLKEINRLKDELETLTKILNQKSTNSDPHNIPDNHY